MTTSTVQWHRTSEQLPDDDTLVLVSGDCVEVLGYVSEGRWHDETGWPLDPRPVWWAHFPPGPQEAER